MEFLTFEERMWAAAKLIYDRHSRSDIAKSLGVSLGAVINQVTEYEVRLRAELGRRWMDKFGSVSDNSFKPQEMLSEREEDYATITDWNGRYKYSQVKREIPKRKHREAN